MPVAGTSGLSFGVTNDSVALWQTAEKTKKCDVNEAKDGAGTITGVSVTGVTYDGKASGLLLSDTVSANVGTVTATTFGDSLLSGNWLCTETNTAKSNSDFTKIDVTVRQFPGIAGLGG